MRMYGRCRKETCNESRGKALAKAMSAMKEASNERQEGKESNENHL